MFTHPNAVWHLGTESQDGAKTFRACRTPVKRCVRRALMPGRCRRHCSAVADILKHCRVFREERLGRSRAQNREHRQNVAVPGFARMADPPPVRTYPTRLNPAARQAYGPRTACVDGSLLDDEFAPPVASGQATCRGHITWLGNRDHVWAQKWSLARFET